MDATQLDAMEPAARGQYVGNFLFPHVCTLVGEPLAGKITGMLLEMTSTEMVNIMGEYEALKQAVNDAVAHLQGGKSIGKVVVDVSSPRSSRGVQSKL